MPWMKVTVGKIGGESINAVINTDTISRFQSLNGGTFIKFVDGSHLEVSDSVQEITDVVLQADANKAK